MQSGLPQPHSCGDCPCVSTCFRVPIACLEQPISRSERSELCRWRSGCYRLGAAPKLRRALAGPASARMAEGAGLLEAKPPRDVRSSKVLFEIAYGEFASHLVEDFSKVQSLGCQPPRESPLAEVHLLGNRLCLRFSVRQKWRDDVLNLCPERTGAGCADSDGFLTR